MKANIISIGNSKGIRIPKTLLEQVNIKGKVDLIVDKGLLIIKPIRKKPRDGWDKAFNLMHEYREDSPLVPENSGLDMEDWEW